MKQARGLGFGVRLDRPHNIARQAPQPAGIQDRPRAAVLSGHADAAPTRSGATSSTATPGGASPACIIGQEPRSPRSPRVPNPLGSRHGGPRRRTAGEQLDSAHCVPVTLCTSVGEQLMATAFAMPNGSAGTPHGWSAASTPWPQGW